MRTVRDVLALNWLYPETMDRQEITNKFHLTLIKIMFIWMIILTIFVCYIRDDIVTRRKLIEEQYTKDTTAFNNRTERYIKLLDNAEKQTNATKQKDIINGTVERR